MTTSEQRLQKHLDDYCPKGRLYGSEVTGFVIELPKRSLLRPATWFDLDYVEDLKAAVATTGLPVTYVVKR